MSTKSVKIYYRPTCPYSQRALQLLDSKSGIKIEKIDITDNNNLREQMIGEANGRTTVPQVFIAGKHIGGCDDLYELEESGRLDTELGL